MLLKESGTTIIETLAKTHFCYLCMTINSKGYYRYSKVSNSR